MKKRKTRKQKIVLGLKRTLKKIDMAVKEIQEEFDNKLKKSLDKQGEYNKERENGGMFVVADYSQADSLNTFLLYLNMERVEIVEKLKELKKRGKRK